MTPRHQDERGASLIMVIVFVMVFGLVTGAILDLAITGFRTTSAVTDVRDDQHVLDAAMEGAINAFRGSVEAGRLGEPCGDFLYDAVAGAGDPNVRVTCTPRPTSAGDDTAPRQAILLLGTAGCDGYAQAGNKRVDIGGAVFSNSRIDVGEDRPGCSGISNGGMDSTLSVEGDVLAVNRCHTHSGGGTRKIFATGKNCLDEPTAPAAKPDPDYPAATTSLPAPIDPAAVCGAGGIVRFQPGTYTELPRNHVPAACAGDTSSMWWFSPGVYYFDFPEPSSLWEPFEFSGSGAEKRAKNIIGGTPRGWNGDSAQSAIRFPGACDAGTEQSPQPGVQFIFGGTSRLRTKSDNSPSYRGEVELCASPRGATQQRIAVYGLKSGTRTQQNSAFKPDSVSTTGFTNPDAARHHDDGGAAATVTLSGDSVMQASLTFPSFPKIAEGSLVNSVRVRLRHVAAGTTSKLTVTLRVRPDGEGAPAPFRSIDLPVTVRTVDGTDEIDITGQLQAAFRYRDAQRLALDLLVSAPKLNATKGCPGNNCTPAETISVNVESLLLSVTHTPPGLRAHQCPAAQPSCALLQSAADPATENPYTVFSGTVYAPTARLVLGIHNGGQTGFRRGIIARSLFVDPSPSGDNLEKPFQLPNVGRRRRVLLEARIGDQPRLRALVEYIDSDGATEVPGYTIQVLSWTPIR